MSGISAVTAIRAEFPEAKVIILTTFEGERRRFSAPSSRSACVPLEERAVEDLVGAIRKVHSGRKHFSTQVAETLAEHFSSDAAERARDRSAQADAVSDRNRDIGQTPLDLGRDCQGSYRHIMNKLGAKDRTQAVSIGLRRGVIHL